MGREIYLSAPPIPQQVVQADGAVLFTGPQIQRGQQAWFSAGGQQLGSVWGHGSYVAPDWSADWLHREALALRDVIAQKRYRTDFANLGRDEQAVVSAQVKEELRSNRYDAETGTLIVSQERAAAIKQLIRHYTGLFGNDAALDHLREQYAMVASSLREEADLQALPSFFFWTAWAAATNRPGETNLSYTSNWPHEPLVGNAPTTGNGMWSIASVILLIAGIAMMIWLHSRSHEDADPAPLKADPLFDLKPTKSMLATRK
ncbi:MAG TPA: nitric-oxide reductase large subunit, partial [Rhodocyclaceae bacterium]|nr:nitric-oxide reductase large subunit [Rhodocyclaceae bacterium]